MQITTEKDFNKEMAKVISKMRQEKFRIVYGVSTIGSIDKKTGRVTKKSVLELFELDYNRHKNRSITKITELYKTYSFAIFFMYSENSIRNNLVQFKNVIKKNGGKFEINALNAFDAKEVYSLIRDGDKKRKEKIEDNVLNRDKNEDSDTLSKDIVIEQIQILKTKLDTKDYIVKRNQKENQVRAYYLLPLLAVASGRRFAEILGTFNIRKNGTKMTFSGLLKGNQDTIEGNLIGLSYKEFKGYLGELREAVDTANKTEAEIAKDYNKVFNNAMKRFGKNDIFLPEIIEYFKSVKRKGRNGKIEDGQINVKGFRDIYAIIGSRMFHDPKRDRDLTQTASRILGHRYVIQSAEGYLNK